MKFFSLKKLSTAQRVPARKRILYFICLAVFLIMGCGQGGTSSRPTLDVPLEYADKHMPEGWWNDAKILSEGRLLYQGVTKPFVNCAKCHGSDGKPTKRGAADFTDTRMVKRFSDSYWFWRIQEGVPMTSMEGWTKKLSDQEIWKIIAYQRNFALRGQVYNPVTDKWEDAEALQKTGDTSENAK